MKNSTEKAQHTTYKNAENTAKSNANIRANIIPVPIPIKKSFIYSPPIIFPIMT